MKVFFSLKSRLFSIHSQPFTHPPLLQNLPIKWLNTNSHDCIFFLCAHLTNTGLVLCSVIGYFEYTQDFPGSDFSLLLSGNCTVLIGLDDSINVHRQFLFTATDWKILFDQKARNSPPEIVLFIASRVFWT